MLDRILASIKEYYDKGLDLPPKLIEKLQESFDIRDKFNEFSSLNLQETSKKMKDLLKEKGYTVELLENLKSIVGGNDLYKINAFIAAVNDNNDEYYISSCVYFNRVLNETADFNMHDAFNSCVSKLMNRGYSKENIMKAFNDYSSTGKFDLGKRTGIVVKLVRSKAPSIEERNDSLEITDADKKEAAELLAAIPGLRDDLNTILKSEDTSSLDSNVPDENLEPIVNDLDSGNNNEPDKIENNQEVTEPVDIQPTSFLGNQPINPFDPTYKAQTISSIDIPGDVDYIGGIDYSKPNDFVEMPNPFEVPYEGTFKKISKIAKKVKRKITKPDFSKLKMKMLKSFLKLMNVDSNVLESAQENSFDYSWDDDMNIEGRSR